MFNFPEFDLYPVITTKFCYNKSAVKTLEALIKTGIKIVQLREKDINKRELFILAKKFREKTSKAAVRLIINDHIDIAMAVNADGVHLGQEDFPCDVCRNLNPDFIIGVSTHNLKEAIKAEVDGASYINIGPIFDTQTKDLPIKALGTKIIKQVASKINIPFTVMGGIKNSNLKEVITAGSKRFAMVTELIGVKDIAAKVEQLRQIIYGAVAK